jgi:hypothetical protein
MTIFFFFFFYFGTCSEFSMFIWWDSLDLDQGVASWSDLMVASFPLITS